MTHTAAAERVAAMTRYQVAWNVVIAAQADLVEATSDPVLRQRQEAILHSFINFQAAQSDYYTWLGLVMTDVQATVNEIRSLIGKHHNE